MFDIQLPNLSMCIICPLTEFSWTWGCNKLLQLSMVFPPKLAGPYFRSTGIALAITSLASNVEEPLGHNFVLSMEVTLSGRMRESASLSGDMINCFLYSKARMFLLVPTPGSTTTMCTLPGGDILTMDRSMYAASMGLNGVMLCVTSTIVAEGSSLSMVIFIWATKPPESEKSVISVINIPKHPEFE